MFICQWALKNWPIMDSTRSQVSLNEYGSEVNHSMSTAFVWNRATYDAAFMTEGLNRIKDMLYSILRIS